jgi:hypothetical protein
MFRHLLPLVLAVLSSAPLAAQELGASWLRTRSLQNALNPKLSAIPDFVAQTGPRGSDGGLRLRELEVGIQSAVDPSVRVDAFIAFPGAGLTGGHAQVEVEEAYATLTTLPWGLALRGGKFLPTFGRLNLIHAPEIDQVTRPLVLESFLGDEGLNSVGAELSASRALGDVLFEGTYAVLNDLGVEGEEQKVDVTAPDGSTVKVKVDEEESPQRRARDYAHVAKLRAARDLGADWTVDAGLSGALHQARLTEHRKLGALDWTVKWKPAQEGLYKSFLWRGEVLHSRRDVREASDINVAGGSRTPGYRTQRRGFYTYAQYQPLQRWKGGLRLDYVESPSTAGTRSPTRAVAPYVTWTLTEFNRLRFQYEYRTLPSRAHENRGFLQWTLVLGPHGAHQF